MRLTQTGLATVSLTLALLTSGCMHQYGQSPSAPTEANTPTPQMPVKRQATAFEQLQQQALRGDIDSQFKLGSFYFVGKPAADKDTASAAADSLATAAPNKNLKQAEYWWRQAANKGHAEAAVSLAYLYTGRSNPEFSNHREMLKYLNQSASAGNPMAQHILGSFYLRGVEGIPRDPAQAKRLYQSACQQRYAQSCKALNNLPPSD